MSSSTTFPINDEDHSAFVVKVYRSDQSFKYFPVHKVKITEKFKINLNIFLLGNNSKTSCYVSYN
jgi:hypothetical protein